jgi:hypothetical protein
LKPANRSITPRKNTREVTNLSGYISNSVPKRMLPIDIRGKEERIITVLLKLVNRYANTPNTPGRRNNNPITLTMMLGICSALKSKSNPMSNEHRERKI